MIAVLLIFCSSCCVTGIIALYRASKLFFTLKERTTAGTSRTPVVESDPQPRQLQNNLYYPQEDTLKAFFQEHPETGWNVVGSLGVVGTATGSALNIFHPMVVYAAVQKHKCEPLYFAGDLRCVTVRRDFLDNHDDQVPWRMGSSGRQMRERSFQCPRRQPTQLGSLLQRAYSVVWSRESRRSSGRQ